MVTHRNPVSLLVLYGSQTGNAQDVAERIGREARRRHFRPRVMPCDAYMPQVSQFPSEPAIIFVTSTTGQGEHPDNMKTLWKFLLRKNLPSNSLATVATAVFGLGDSGYPKYNVVSKKLYRRLESLGARMVLPLGQGDDQHRSGYEAALDPWLAQLWGVLRQAFPLPPGVSEPSPADTSTELIPKYTVTHLPPSAWPTPGHSHDPPTSAVQHAEEVAAARAFDVVEAVASGLPLPATSAPVPVASSAPGPGGGLCRCGDSGGTAAPAAAPNRGTTRASQQQYSASTPCFARLAVNRRLTGRDHFQDVRHLEFQLGEDGPQFQPGDVLAIMPRQPKPAVEQFLERCGLDPQAWVRVEPAEQLGKEGGGEGPPLASATVQIGPLVAGALDINGASPRRFFFQVLRHFAASEVETERLEYFASAEGRDDLYAYNQREGRTVAEVLADFKSATLPLEWLLQTVPRLKPRLFSIASSPLLHPRTVHLTVAIVDWVTPFKRRRRGVCTSWLAGLTPGEGSVEGPIRVPVWVERGALRLPASPSVPLILVGPGTGVAPFRAFLQHRQALIRSGAEPKPSPSMLFFGCRNAGGDFLYREEWEQMQQEGVLAAVGGLVTAFSRDQPSKVYVQHRIREQAEHVWSWLSVKGAAVYVAGSADKMPAQVAAAFEDVASMAGKLTEEEAQKWVRQLEVSARYQVEAWS